MRVIRNCPSIVLLFAVCCLLFAAGEQSSLRAMDEQVSVTPQSQESTSSSMVQSCLRSQAASSYRVRFQAIKTQTTSFSRLLIDMFTVETYSSELEIVSSSNIGDCANTADAGGFSGFSFNNGSCKMFNLERQICRCYPEGEDVIFVQDSVWDEKDEILPQLVPMESFTVAKYRGHFEGQVNLYFSIPLNADLEPGSLWVQYLPGFINILCTETECWVTDFFDMERCSVACDDQSNLTISTAFSFGQYIVDEEMPPIYMLSHCGETITGKSPSADWPQLPNIPFMAFRVMSHQGYGCEWYSKEDEDHECAVTFKAPANTSMYLSLSALLRPVDGDNITCEGDSFEIYSEGVDKIINACSGDTEISAYLPESSVTLVFKRSAQQYQEDGYNSGLSFYISVFDF